MKRNRIWAQQKEALTILSQNPEITGKDLVTLLFNMGEEEAKEEKMTRAQWEALSQAQTEVEVKEEEAEKVEEDAEALAAAIDARLAGE